MFRNKFSHHLGALILLVCVLAGFHQKALAAPAEFIVAHPAPNPALPSIILPYDAAAKTGLNWQAINQLPYYSQDVNMPVQHAVRYLCEAMQRMTGNSLPVISGTDLSHGIVLTTLALAPADVRDDPAVQKALQNSGKDSYNANEAFFIRSESKRVLVVANTPNGLMDGVVELLESVGYEVLGMGKDWIYTPDFHSKPLIFNIERAGRPGFYIRNLWATSGQFYGVGTLTEVADPGDESVFDSYLRWRVGTRMAGQSMANFPGHNLQGYHKAVIERMRETKTTAGFLVPKTTLGLDAERPAATAENNDTLWINTDADGAPQAGKVFISNGTNWVSQNPNGIGANLDLSVPLVRETILKAVETQAKDHFEKNPDELFIIGTEPEDGGGYATLGKLLNNPNWYPDYLKRAAVKFDQPYMLNGFKGLNQPNELWDPDAPADTVYGFNNWLLREFDQWIDALPAADRVTVTGKNKKALARTSLYSYNFHDVPPNFNLDPRIRVMIASFPKHRGFGKWKNFRTQTDMAEAYQVMLPREPSGDYWIISESYYTDFNADGIGGSEQTAPIAQRMHEEYHAGFRALSAETDFNFGKQGLEYYLYSKMLWNPDLTAAQLNALRDRWLQRAFGGAWQEMKQYYDFMAPENYAINAPNNWAKAIRFIDAASQKIDGDKEPDAQQRIDDLKQYWYYYYLTETNQAKPDSRAFKEFVWKGQMSYMTAMHMAVRRIFNTNSAKDAAGPEFNTGSARYTHEETQAWWAKVLDTWKVTPVNDFAAATLADGTSGRAVDQNDVVTPQEFAQGPPDVPYCYNGATSGAYSKQTFLTTTSKTSEEIGFKVFWQPNAGTNSRPFDVYYGISHWKLQKKVWEELVDKTMVSAHSESITGKDGKEYQQAVVRYAAPQPGTYKIEVMDAGDGAGLTTLDYSLLTGEYSDTRGQTYIGNLSGLTQSPVYFYIPKNTKSLDLEVWDTFHGKSLQLYNGLPTTGMKPTRKIDVGERGTHVVKLEPGEDGSLAMLSSNGFAFPYLYSVPMLWAKSPAALMVPRAIAKADDLTIAAGH